MKRLFIYAAIIITIAGCAKDGATGPAGPQGAQGTNGTNGTNGNNGTDGNANVSSQEFTVTNWSNSTTEPALVDTITDPRITQSILDSGLVMIYKKALNTWTPLPLVTYFSGVIFTMSYTYWLNTVLVTYKANNGTIPTNPGQVTFKVVVISGHLRMANPHINWNNYEEVKSVLNLKEDN